jgi:hypothetical protein
MVVPVTPPDTPHRMITRGKTGFWVVPDHLVLTAVTSSPTPSPIPSSARATLANPHCRAAMEEEYGRAGSPASGLQRCHRHVGLHAQAPC